MNNELYFKNKYLKYKKKYLELKELLGGGKYFATEKWSYFGIKMTLDTQLGDAIINRSQAIHSSPAIRGDGTIEIISTDKLHLTLFEIRWNTAWHDKAEPWPGWYWLMTPGDSRHKEFTDKLNQTFGAYTLKYNQFEYQLLGEDKFFGKNFSIVELTVYEKFTTFCAEIAGLIKKIMKDNNNIDLGNWDQTLDKGHIIINYHNLLSTNKLAIKYYNKSNEDGALLVPANNYHISLAKSKIGTGISEEQKKALFDPILDAGFESLKKSYKLSEVGKIKKL